MKTAACARVLVKALSISSVDRETAGQRVGDGGGRITGWSGENDADGLRAGGGIGRDGDATGYLCLADVNVAGAGDAADGDAVDWRGGGWRVEGRIEIDGQRECCAAIAGCRRHDGDTAT